MSEKTDHDLLIELNKTVELLFAQQRSSFETHMKEDTESFTEIKGIARAAHSRLDKIFSVKDKVVGGFAVMSFLFGAAVSILALLPKGVGGG